MRSRRGLSPHASAAIVAAILSALYLAAARSYRLGNLTNPGAGLFPLLVGIALLVTSLSLLLVEVIRARSPAHPHALPADQPRTPFMDRTMLTFAGVSVLYPMAVAAVGFEVATAAALAGMSFAMGERGVMRLVLLGVLGAAASHLLFRRLLGVPLP
ncbi:MAG: tripartite tricarboxylate transporter TctB family protein [Armatimonadota bacterium]|nr:tripartite tricarboxylate transporter TctB family protein [Armatimonadota bacterium]MDR7463169.1 tripartite tricarboxylate transporter TctB family protein [Armatimonadota bacterium]MDR7468844.1 tripartite tricarboxylate transporter TctB family protein [Armatimonadota bacterium]MDR7475414.1 tripartite tricarboxylate transporter TctB family protein [Armatimonadota bacterium]MDR7540183.1 tripartite tricarboxylate transporter TctB family protein [Armatimonadota bacterium]